MTIWPDYFSLSTVYILTKDNMTDIPLLSKTYRCAECADYEVGSTSDIAKDLD